MNNIGVLILNYNNYMQTIECVESIKKLNMKLPIVIVDNASTNNSLEIIRKKFDNECKIISSAKNNGYSSGNNLGLKWYSENTDIKYVIVCNPDAFFSEEYVDRIYKLMEKNNKIGLLTGIMKNKDKTIVKNQYWNVPTYMDDIFNCLLIIKKVANFFYYNKKITYKENENIIYAVPAGSCEIINLEIFKKIEYFDEKCFLFYEENIIASKLKENNFQFGICKDVFYYHLHSTTIKNAMSLIEKHNIYLKSLYYYEKTYNKISFLKLILLKIICSISRLEFYIYQKIKSLKKRKI